MMLVINIFTLCDLLLATQGALRSGENEFCCLQSSIQLSNFLKNLENIA